MLLLGQERQLGQGRQLGAGETDTCINSDTSLERVGIFKKKILCEQRKLTVYILVFQIVFLIGGYRWKTRHGRRDGGVRHNKVCVCSVMKNNHILSMSLLLLLINSTHFVSDRIL